MDKHASLHTGPYHNHHNHHNHHNPTTTTTTTTTTPTTKTTTTTMLGCRAQVVVISVVAQRQLPLILTVQKTIVILQLQFIDKVFDVSVVQVQQVPRVSRDPTFAFFALFQVVWS